MRVLLCVICVAIAAPWCPGAVVISYIGGTVSGSLQTSGEHEGLYMYEFDIDWELAKGLSHVNLVLPECLQTEGLVFEFDVPAGYSTGQSSLDPYAIQWLGQFEHGDPSIGLVAELLKYEPIEVGDEPGKVGTGYFWVYSNMRLECMDSTDIVAGKSGADPVYGQVVPEPATVFLLGMGWFLAFACKNKANALWS